MIFNIRTYNNPKVSDKRVLKKFAFLPTRINDLEVYWLRFYYSHQSYNLISTLPQGKLAWVECFKYATNEWTKT